MSNYINETRQLLLEKDFGVISTFHSETLDSSDLYPFGSLIQFDVHPTGDIIIKTATISEHFKNLSKNPKASLFFLENSSSENIQASARVTLLLNFQLVEEAEVSAIRQSYLRRFPSAIPPEIEGGFRYWRGIVRKIRWIAGFGRMGWIGADEYYCPAPK